VVVQAAVLVDDEDAAARLFGRCPRTQERPALGPDERDRLGRDRRLQARRPGRARSRWAPCCRRISRESREQRRARREAQSEQAESSQRLAPRDDPVDVVLGDLLRQVPLELSHRFPPSDR
jgi:hypothetical protein